MNIPIFQQGDFTLASGIKSWWKIECDQLTYDDWQCLARIAIERLPPFSEVIGVPRGGLLFAKALQQYKYEHGLLLVVDDVYTTGKSIAKYLKPVGIGLVAFARTRPPNHIYALWQLWG